MKVYRYENDVGMGPFCTGVVPSCLPSPYNDNIPDFDTDMIVGCTSMVQLALWFDKDAIEYIKMKGFTLRIYDIPDGLCYVGNFQVAFFFY